MTDPTASATAIAQIEATLAALPNAERAALQTLRQTIAAAAPEAEETISYGMPAFRYRGRALVSYAGFKAHCSLFSDELGADRDASPRTGGLRHRQGHPPVHARAPAPDRSRGAHRA